MQTTLSYQLPYQRSGEDYQITIDIFDLLGRRVRTLFKGSQPPGDYLRIWDGRDSNNLPLASGIFIFREDRSMDCVAKSDPLEMTKFLEPTGSF